MRIGITGHQAIADPLAWDWVREEFRTLLQRHGASGRVLAALAVGADQLFAEVAAEMQIPIDVVLPSDGYESTFGNTRDRRRYRELLDHAATIRTLPFPCPSEDAFMAAGRYLVDHSDLIVALWNGRPAAGKGGTGDVVQYARSVDRPLVHIHPDLLQVL